MVEGVEFTWTCAITGVVSFNVTDDGTVHVGRLCGLESDVVTEQVRFTCPVNAPSGVMVIVDVPDCPGAGMIIVVGFADKVKSELVTATAAEVEPA